MARERSVIGRIGRAGRACRLAALLVSALGVHGVVHAQGLGMGAPPKDKPASRPAKLDFTLKDSDGKSVQLSKLKDKLVVLEWIEPGCPSCRRHAAEHTMNQLVARYAKKKEVVFLGICTSSRSDAKAVNAFRKKHGLKYRILMDPDGRVGRTFGAKKTPHMFVVRNGRKLYEGAIDDDPRGIKKGSERVNYVARVVDQALAGKKIAVAYTRPYG